MSDASTSLREEADSEQRSSTGDPGVEIRRIATEARNWLFNEALPLWATVGRDDINGGFYEQINFATQRPIYLPKRCRVQARQVYVFSEAGRLGWEGSWRHCARSGLDFMLRKHLRPDGLMRFTTTLEGAVCDDSVDNYDQAFAIFGLAHAHPWATDIDTAGLAKNLSTALRSQRGHYAGGFREGDGARAPLLANSHMHLLEAALAWLDFAPASVWRDFADEMARLCLTYLIDQENGALREYFEADWRPRDGEEGRIVEPGHQFEWASLLLRWRVHGGNVDLDVPRRLYAYADEAGLDASTDLVISEILENGAVRDAMARLWPQMERLKAAIGFASLYPEEKSRFETDAVRAWRGLQYFIDPAPKGMFTDKRKPDGSFAQEGALASSLYHIVGGVSELIRYAKMKAPA